MDLLKNDYEWEREKERGQNVNKIKSEEGEKKI